MNGLRSPIPMSFKVSFLLKFRISFPFPDKNKYAVTMKNDETADMKSIVSGSISLNVILKAVATVDHMRTAVRPNIRALFP